MSGQSLVVMVTAPSSEKAAEIARCLVDERLAACVTVVEKVRSIYRWEGKVEEAAEALMLIKTRAEVFERLKERVLGLHPYQCPEIIGVPVEFGHRDYLAWMEQSLR
jgi:periplasmic divalent cation tolerance protein